MDGRTQIFCFDRFEAGGRSFEAGRDSRCSGEGCSEQEEIGTVIKEHLKDGDAEDMVNRLHAILSAEISAIKHHNHGLVPT